MDILYPSFKLLVLLLVLFAIMFARCGDHWQDESVHASAELLLLTRAHEEG